jgi:hypothetical protein
MVLTVCFVLSPAIGLSCHRRQRMKGSPAPGRAGFASADLTPASRRQDHTTSPSASASFVGTPSDRSRETRPATTCAPDAAASTASRPNVRDDGQRPSSERDGDSIKVILVCGEAEYFCKGGWTAKSVICPSGKSADGAECPRNIVERLAALTYRWIEKPAMEAARRDLSTTRRTASGIASPAPWLRAGSARRIGLILRWRARSLVVSARASIELGLGAVRAIAGRRTADIGT